MSMVCLHFSMLALHLKKRVSIRASSGKESKRVRYLATEKIDRQTDPFSK
jgi:hypothetical protein